MVEYQPKNVFLVDNSKISHQNIDAISGSNVTVHCNSSTSVQWIFINTKNRKVDPLPLNVVVERNTLSVYLIESENQGRYKCRGTTEEYHRWSLSRVSFEASVILTIVESLEPTDVLPGKIII